MALTTLMAIVSIFHMLIIQNNTMQSVVVGHDNNITKIPEYFSQTIICSHPPRLPGNSTMMHCGILFDMSYHINDLHSKCLSHLLLQMKMRALLQKE